MRLLAPPVFPQQQSEVMRGAQFPQLRLLSARDSDGTAQTHLRLIALPKLTLDQTAHPQQLGFDLAFSVVLEHSQDARDRVQSGSEAAGLGACFGVKRDE